MIISMIRLLLSSIYNVLLQQSVAEYFISYRIKKTKINVWCNVSIVLYELLTVVMLHSYNRDHFHRMEDRLDRMSKSLPSGTASCQSNYHCNYWNQYKTMPIGCGSPQSDQHAKHLLLPWPIVTHKQVGIWKWKSWDFRTPVCTTTQVCRGSPHHLQHKRLLLLFFFFWNYNNGYLLDTR